MFLRQSPESLHENQAHDPARCPLSDEIILSGPKATMATIEFDTSMNVHTPINAKNLRRHSSPSWMYTLYASIAGCLPCDTHMPYALKFTCKYLACWRLGDLLILSRVLSGHPWPIPRS